MEITRFGIPKTPFKEKEIISYLNNIDIEFYFYKPDYLSWWTYVELKDIKAKWVFVDNIWLFKDFLLKIHNIQDNLLKDKPKREWIVVEKSIVKNFFLFLIWKYEEKNLFQFLATIQKVKIRDFEIDLHFENNYCFFEIFDKKYPRDYIYTQFEEEEKTLIRTQRENIYFVKKWGNII